MGKGVLAAALLSGACVGSIGDGGGGSDPANAANGDGADGGVGAAGLSWPLATDGTPSALRRLTRDELIATLQTLTGSVPSRDDLPSEPRHGNGALLTGGLSYIATELPKLENVLADFTTKIAPTMLGKSGCTQTAQAQRDCLGQWAQGFAARALRRPARASEMQFYVKLLATADGTPAADTSAVSAVLEAIFFSPSFLYRTEIGAAAAGSTALRQLAPEEIASRLSFLAGLTPPDSQLSDAAAAGKLADGQERVRQFDRIAQTDLGKHAMAVLVLEWLGSNEPKIHTKSQTYLAGLPADFEASVRASAESTIAGALSSDPTATLANLLTTTSYAKDPAIVAVAQSAGATGDTNETGRAGLLMHPQVLAAHTKEDGVSPFRLGVFLREDMLCQPVSPPPAGAQAMALTDIPGASLRENYQHKISAGPQCLACHGQFAPLGYALLPFDPVGRWMKQDPSGKPWDLSGAIADYSGTLAFSSPSDLMQKFGASPQVRGCFAQAALEWALGRHLVNDDLPAASMLNDVVKRTDGNVLAILRAIVSAPQFITAVAPR